jgi:hypothetical protein
MKKKRRSRGLAGLANAFAASLLFEASGGKVGRGRTPSEGDPENPVSFKDRRALLDSVTKLLAAQPEAKDDEEDGIASFREALGGGDSREVERGADTDADETGVQPDSREA